MTSLELRRRGVNVRIHGQPLQILALLVSRPGALVTRGALRHALWPEGTFVDHEHGLNAAVRRLRRALEDDASAPRFIETLARRGYRFVASIDAEPNARRSDEPPAATIAVLPFGNATGDSEVEYLVEGITERLIGELAVNQDLRVIASSAVLRHKDEWSDPCALGRRLGVNAAVAGTIRWRTETSLSIRVELLDVARGFLIWGASYERRSDDLSSLEHELARAIHSALEPRRGDAEARRLRKPGTSDAVAHREYLKGRYFLNRMAEGGIRRAVDHFSRATAADRRYGLAYCGLAECYCLFAFLGLEAPDVALPKAREAARTALAIDDRLAEAHASLASITKVYDWNWDEAEIGYRRALALNPSYAAAHRWYAAHLAAMGRRREALSAIQRALELDPVSPIIVTELAWHAYMAREFDLAQLHARDALDLQPDFAPALFALGLACEQLHAYEEALEAFRAAAAQSPNTAVVASEAHLLARRDRKHEALSRSAQVEEWARQRYVAPYWLAVIAAGFEDRQATLTWLERAADQHDVWLVWLKTEPRLDPFRGDARFQRVLERIGLTSAAAVDAVMEFETDARTRVAALTLSADPSADRRPLLTP